MTTQTYIFDSQTDLKQIIQIIIRKIIGETCCQIDFSYGNELQLDFGEMKAHSHPKLLHLSKGSWQLSTRASKCILKKNSKILISDIDIDLYNRLELDMVALGVLETVRQLQNKKLNDLVIDNISMGLTLFFEDNYQFILNPDLEDDSGLAYWELIMPNEQMLTVGPGLFWEYKSIH
jgi:hypothetical protein